MPQKPVLHVMPRGSQPLVAKPGDVVTVKVGQTARGGASGIFWQLRDVAC